jgi:hypothetical protein
MTKDYTRIYNSMEPDEKVWIDGFIMGLAFVQAHNDREGGSQTVETHLPTEWWEPRGKQWVRLDNLEDKILATIYETDDGGILFVRFLDRTDKGYTYRVMELGSSEGHFGAPDWA